VEDIQKKTVATFESIDINTINEMQRSVVVLPDKKEEKINRNKPWRIVIRRNVVDGGSTDEDIR
jgi:hypothetical protein